jgi:hypothetical protein
MAYRQYFQRNNKQPNERIMKMIPILTSFFEKKNLFLIKYKNYSLNKDRKAGIQNCFN